MRHIYALVVAIGFAFVGLTAATPTPIPGGANQLSGVSGGLASALFNGKIRIRQMTLRPSTSAEFAPADGNTGLVFSWLASNGTHATRTGYFSASLSDADGVLIEGKALSVYGAFYSLQPGAAAHGSIQFIVPTGYKATKILLTDEGSPAGPVFRIQLQATDVPAPAAT